MIRRILLASVLACGLAAGGLRAAPSPAPAPAQQVVDRIAARIENDIITTSQMRELAAYQQLVDGKAQSDADLLSELIEQWVVNNEATNARFPAAAQSEVSREVDRIAAQFPTPAAYQQRLASLGLTAEAVRRMVAEQIFLARYLDYKFRTTVQVSDSDIQNYYRQDLVPDMAAKKEPAPPLDQVHDQIRELLVQQGISKAAASWVDDTKAGLNIEIEPAAGVPAESASHAPQTRQPGKTSQP